MVVANMLQTHRQRVILVTPEANQELFLTREEVHAGIHYFFIILLGYFYKMLFLLLLKLLEDIEK